MSSDYRKINLQTFKLTTQNAEQLRRLVGYVCLVLDDYRVRSTIVSKDEEQVKQELIRLTPAISENNNILNYALKCIVSHKHKCIFKDLYKRLSVLKTIKNKVYSSTLKECRLLIEDYIY